MTEVTRPALRWHGGKWNLAGWIMEHFPAHRIYVEPFGGAASVLLRKPASYAEVYNDLDDEVVNLFRLLREAESAARLCELLRRTPFAREEFNAAYEVTDDPVERARRLVIRSHMGFGSDGACGSYRTGFRANSNRSGTTPAHDWANFPPALAAIAERMTGVIIESRPAVQVMKAHDGPETLHYADPPYLHETRKRGGRVAGVGSAAVYRHEMSTEDHETMLEALCALKGMVVLSGYPSALYDDALKGWTRRERPALADGARKRTEVLWLNPACVAALEAENHQPPLIAEDAA
ncbi:MAG: DNA adenine methylase [Alphaproteobacteria bacterium]|nr:DNA adenine methylase [Alphaproteobacteria bacterium]